MSNDRYFKPSVTVDVLALRWNQESPELLLIQRANAPYRNSWALPGGFIEEQETLLCSAQRELQEETGLTVSDLTFFGVYGTPGRDPRGRTLTMAYYVLIPYEKSSVIAQDDASDAHWFKLVDLPELAFDHAHIIQEGLHQLLSRLQGIHPLGGTDFLQNYVLENCLSTLNTAVFSD